MINQTIAFECITPCLCAGADQAIAEIRPSAIRGALRWWFRALGGSPDQEIDTFGGGSSVRASALQIRVSDVVHKSVGQLPNVGSQMSPKAYILYYARIAGGNRSNFGSGPRWNNQGMFGTGTTFTLTIRQLRTISDESLTQLAKSLTAFQHYGSIGLRVTRGMGAVQAQGVSDESFAKADALLNAHGFTVRHGTRPHKVWDGVLEEAGKWLKFDLRKECTAGESENPKASPLGSIKPRQSSAVYLRPIKRRDDLFFAAFEAPHHRVLGPCSQRASGSLLDGRDFSGPLPTPPTKGIS